MKKDVVISLSVSELECLKRLVKERIAVWQVRVDCADTAIELEHNRFNQAYYHSLLKSLENE